MKYAVDRGLAPEPGFACKSIKWAITLDGTGVVTGVIPLGDAENPGRTFPRCPHLSPSELKSGAKYSQFLHEWAGIVRLGAEEENQVKQKKFQCFVGFILECAETAASLASLAAFVKREDQLQLMRQIFQEKKIKDQELVTFECGGRFILDEVDWVPWWRQKRASMQSGCRRSTKQAQEGDARCLVTGKMTRAKARHDGIKGLSGEGKAAVRPFVSFDKDAFESYGLKVGSNAAVSDEAEAAYRAGLNDLVRTTGKHFGTSTVVHWFKEAIELADDPLAFLVEPTAVKEAAAQRRAKELLESIRTGKRADLGGNRYYALTLSGSGGRVMVRDWMEGPFAELAGNVAQWFEDLAIVSVDGDGLAPDRGILWLARSCLRARTSGGDNKEADLTVRRIADRLLGPAVRGGAIPDMVAGQVLARIRATAGKVDRSSGKSIRTHTPERAALLRGAG